MNLITKIKEFQFPEKIDLEIALIVVSWLFMPVMFIKSSLGEYLQVIVWLMHFALHWLQYKKYRFTFNAVFIGISFAFFIESFIMMFVKF